MDEIISCKQLVDIASGFEDFVYEQFLKELVLCHPIVEIIFLPKTIVEAVPERLKDKFLDVRITGLFLTSESGLSWGFDYSRMEEKVSHGEPFYIADFNLNAYMNIESHLLDDAIDTLSHKLSDTVILHSPRKWKRGRLGRLSFITIDELFSK